MLLELKLLERMRSLVEELQAVFPPNLVSLVLSLRLPSWRGDSLVTLSSQ
jgi:hypothetical protein